ncbi:MAG TPA: cell division protein ZipA C-terminal FtsZ-binding domain-containing protein [Burkholderiales bacterium]|nr:cell division protein ZipA C-terminal FtsZ-binding domain-containing protein [Burkholderiales bacterium]
MLGIVALVGVLGYNYVQERSARRQAERSFASRHPDVLLPEPEARREPTLEPHRRPEPQPGAAPDARVDYVIELSLPPSREEWTAVEHRFGRRALLEGNRAALQMVTREGVVSEAELLEFRSEVETLAAKAQATVRAPEMRPALEAAQELDRACADADVQVALHVVGAPGAEAPAGEHPFQVSPREDGLTLTLDVARTPEPGRSYEAMVRAGRQVAAAGGGRLVDDNGTALDDRALATIGAQLEAVRQELAGRGIEPGSPLALRLFS